MNINCRSIRGGKSSEFQAALNYIRPDIVCGTESWLKGVQPGKAETADSIKSSEVFPQNYNAFRNDRGTLGGGVFVLVHQDLISEEKPELVTNCEIEWTKVKVKGSKDLLISSFYMPHRSLIHVSELKKSLELTTTGKEKHIILAGDFNCPDIDWKTLTVRNNAQDREVQQALLDVITEFNLTQIHDQPTRENNLLYLIFTSNPSIIKSTANAPGISDHAIVVADSDTKPIYVKQKPRKCLIYSKANWEQIKADSKNISQRVTSLATSDSTTDQLWNIFKHELKNTIDRNIPTRTKKSNNSTPWLTMKLRRMLKRKARLYKKARATNNWSLYKDYQKHCKRKFRKAEWTHVNDIINEGLKSNNTKPFWRFIKSKKEDNVGVAPLKDKGHLTSDSKTKAELLVKHFESVFTSEHVEQLPEFPNRISENIEHLVISQEGVRKLLLNLDTIKAGGPDQLPTKVLQQCAVELAPAVTSIFQSFIDSGELPLDWRNSFVTPVFKKGDRHLPENYRPV
ncbi:uncharacterized protein LOC128217460 [Mya arenaria]|uniref:uncharacterized protein LOC128217460 n=1 Tax=Mya arenaria TaxID=6604 RepID=UPI0022E839EA|nr:uncharacterized protein LOC128217460 [Mya arenaria]